MNKFIKSDPMLCIGCRTCMIACVVNHTGKNIFTMDPDSYDFTPRVQIQITKDMTRPVQCHQCPKPKCLEACPFKAISMGEDMVILDQDICKGCGKCAKACPFGAITMARIYHGDTKGRPFRQLAFKCDLCRDTESGVPACIEACPTEVFTLFDPAEAAAKAKAAKAALEAKKAAEAATTQS